jgi:hypothetical protein
MCQNHIESLGDNEEISVVGTRTKSETFMTIKMQIVCRTYQTSVGAAMMR